MIRFANSISTPDHSHVDLQSIWTEDLAYIYNFHDSIRAAMTQKRLLCLNKSDCSAVLWTVSDHDVSARVIHFQECLQKLLHVFPVLISHSILIQLLDGSFTNLLWQVPCLNALPHISFHVLVCELRMTLKACSHTSTQADRFLM